MVDEGPTGVCERVWGGTPPPRQVTHDDALVKLLALSGGHKVYCSPVHFPPTPIKRIVCLSSTLRSLLLPPSLILTVCSVSAAAHLQANRRQTSRATPAGV